MRQIARKLAQRKAAKKLMRQLSEIVRIELQDFVVDTGLAALQTVLEAERSEVCGPRYLHQSDRKASRSGHTHGELVLGGRRVGVKRPRAHTKDGDEVILPSWAMFSDEDPLDNRAVEQMLLGVSSRRYNRSLEECGDVATRGTSKSAVSRRFVKATEEQVTQWLSRDLSNIDLVALMIDGVYIHDHVMLAAVGIDIDGKKHVLGIREGSTENSTTVTELLSDLQARGLRTSRTILAVIDGSKALAKGLREFFGKRVVIQRCQIHKIRNVVEQVSKTRRASVAAAMHQAYRCRNAGRAKRLLLNLANTLNKAHPGAAASLLEGLDETLTVMRLKLSEGLERTLSNTNIIENLMGSVRKTSARVQNWRDGAMIQRWTAMAVIEAEPRFHRIRNYKDLKALVVVLNHMSSVDDLQKAG